MSELKTSQLDLVVAGTEDAVLMVESEARELPEAVMLDAVMFGHQQMQTVIKAIKEMAADVGKPRWDWQAVETDKAIKDAVRELAAGAIAEAYRIAQKQDRQNRLADIRQDVLAKLTTATEGGGAQFNSEHVRNVLDSLEKDVVRGRNIGGERHNDDHETHTEQHNTKHKREKPQTHKTTLFTRGETQALVVSTLG